MTGTISTTITSTYNLVAQYTTVLNTGEVTVTSGAAITGTYVSSTYGWTVTNSGKLLSSSAVVNGVDLHGIGDHVTNNASAVIGAVANGVYLGHPSGTVVNAGTIISSGVNYSAVELSHGGYVTNAASGTITSTNTAQGHGVDIRGTAGTVVNAGLITNYGTNSGADVNLVAGGFVSNAASGHIIAAARSGVYVTGGLGTVVNAGYITSRLRSAIFLNAGGTVTNASTGTLSGTSGTAIYMKGGAGTVVNAGLIQVTGTHSGLALEGGGSVTNLQSGIITGGPGHSNIYITGGAGAVNNYGTLAGNSATSVVFEAGGSVTNHAGAIIAGGSGHVAIFTTLGSAGVINAGLVVGGNNATGIALDGGGIVTNQVSGTISGSTTHSSLYITGGTGTVINYGKIVSNSAGYSGVHLHQGGVVSNQSSGIISGGTAHTAIYITGATGTVINDGLIFSSGASNGIVLHAGGTVVNEGAVGGGKAGTIAGVFMASGYADRLVADPGAVFTGFINGGNPIGTKVVSTLELASAASFGVLSGIGTEFINFGSIDFDAGSHWFINGNTAGLAGPTASLASTISGFAAGDTIEVTGVVATGSTYSGGILTVFEASGSIELNLPGVTGTLALNNLPAGVDITVTCFRAGTRITTARGEVPVEQLRIGEMLPAHIGDGQMMLQRIEWIGHRSIDCRNHPRPAMVWPVLIRAGAFGHDTPHRDLYLSPDHAVFIDGALIPVKCLINDRSIVQVPMSSVQYFHIELAAHGVLLAEGLHVESYLDAGDRSNFANGGQRVTLHPEFVARTWDARGCATLILAGPRLQATRALLDTIADSYAPAFASASSIA